MPYKDRDITKLYYSMGEVTAMFDVNASQIRFYEREFDILQPKKNKKGNRLFTSDDVENLKIIFNLVKENLIMASSLTLPEYEFLRKSIC